jgi:hypothetical protein
MEIPPLLDVAEQTFTRYLGIFANFVVFQIFYLFFHDFSRKPGSIPRIPVWEKLVYTVAKYIVNNARKYIRDEFSNPIKILRNYRKFLKL